VSYVLQLPVYVCSAGAVLSAKRHSGRADPASVGVQGLFESTNLQGMLPRCIANCVWSHIGQPQKNQQATVQKKPLRHV
jgi:hypothetical protein